MTNQLTQVNLSNITVNVLSMEIGEPLWLATLTSVLYCVVCCSDATPLINKASSDHMFETMAMEIEQLLAGVSVLCEINHN